MEDTRAGNVPLPIKKADAAYGDKIFTAEGYTYKTAEQIAAEEQAARVASNQSKLFNNPSLANVLAAESMQQSAMDTAKDAVQSTAAMRIAAYFKQEGQITRHYLANNGYSGLALEAETWFEVMTGQNSYDPNYDKQKFAPELTTGVPVQYWDELLSYDNKHSAMAARARIMTGMQRDQRIAAQRGTASTLAMLGGGFFDVDLPLTTLSGGAYGGVKIARAGYKAGRYIGLSSKAAGAAADVASGAWAGAQAGAVVAGGLALTDDRATYETALDTILSGATTGGGLGVFFSGPGRKVAADMRAENAMRAVTRPAHTIDTDIDKRQFEGAVDHSQFVAPPVQAGRGYGIDSVMGNYKRITPNDNILNDPEFADTRNAMKSDLFPANPDDIQVMRALGWHITGKEYTHDAFTLHSQTRHMESASWDTIANSVGITKWVRNLESAYDRLNKMGYGDIRDPLQDRATAQQDLNRLFLGDPENLRIAREALDKLGGDKNVGPLLGKQDADGGAYWPDQQPNGMSGTITLGTPFQSPKAMVFMHELSHWAYMNVLTPADRLEFWRAMRKYHGGSKPMRGKISDALPDRGISSNSGHGPQELFAVQFEMWASRKLSAGGNGAVLNTTLWEKVSAYMREIMDRYLYGVPIDKELEPLFEKIMPSTQAAAKVKKPPKGHEPAIKYKRPTSKYQGVQIPEMRTGPMQSTPFGKPLPEEAAFIHAITQQMVNSGARKMLDDLANTQWGKIMLGDKNWITHTGVVGKAMATATDAVSRAANAVGNDVISLYKSKANTANWFAMTLLESPSSFGRGVVTATASALDAMMFKKIGSTMVQWDRVVNDWAKKNKQTIRAAGKQTGFGISREGAVALYREVRLAMNDIRMGRPPRSGDDPHVSQLITMVQQHGYESLKWLKGDDPQFSVKGTEFLEPDPGYVPQRANGDVMYDLIQSGKTTREDIEAAFAEGYRNAGTPQEIAEIIAKANVGRALARASDVDTSLIDLLQEDGRAFLRERLELQNMSQEQIDKVMEHLTGLQAMAGQPGFTKHRTDLDMDITVRTKDGADLRIVDLMDNDLPNLLTRYRKGVAGAGALARKGIRSRKDRDVVIASIRHEQESLKETPIDTDKLKAMLTDFDAGPTHGYYNGTTNKGVDPVVSVAKRIANLSLLANLGFSQVIDHANLMAADGLVTWWNHTKAGQRTTSALGANNRDLLEDLAVLQGEIGLDQIIFREHVGLDEISERDMAPWLTHARKLTANLTHLQGYTSMFNQIRGHQQRVSAAIVTNKVIRAIKNGELADRVKYDFGLSDKMVEYIKSKIADGTIAFNSIGGVEYVNRLNHSAWDAGYARDFGAAMVRAQDALVMRNLPGEVDTWMRSNWGAVVTHLKMFPLTAIPKQLMRNGRFMDQQTAGSVMYGMAVAYLAMKVRDTLMGKELSERDQAMRAIGYSNMLGWVPMVVDPTMTMLGLDEYRMQRYGRYWETTVPIVETANKLWRAPGAAINAVQGDMNGDDKAALLAIPFLKTLGIGEWILGLGKR